MDKTDKSQRSASVIRNSRITATAGKNYGTKHYSLAARLFERNFDDALKQIRPPRKWCNEREDC